MEIKNMLKNSLNSQKTPGGKKVKFDYIIFMLKR
jgi:hypothetical protein